MIEYGIDYDLEACLQYNPQDTFTVHDISKVLAVWEGENDGDDWRWVLQLKDGRYVFLIGGCDYTGWDCQSWASHAFADTPEQAALFAKSNDVEVFDEGPGSAGLGHLLSMMSGDYLSNSGEVYESLSQQLLEGKDKTWSERKDEEYGNPPRIDIDTTGAQAD